MSTVASLTELDDLSATPHFSTSNLFLSLKTPLDGEGSSPLTIESFEGVEEISKPFEFEIHMLSAVPDIKFDDLINKPATISMVFDTGERHINGVISELVQMDSTTAQDYDPEEKDEELQVGITTTRYRMIIRPKFWFLKLHRQCRIFQNTKPIDIIKEILGEDTMVIDIKDKVESNGQKEVEYCVQYNESNFDFASRLMEEYGIFYYFMHEEDKHTMVLADAPDHHDELENAAEMQLQTSDPTLYYFNRIHRTELYQQAVPGSYSHTDYNYNTPSTNLMGQAEGDEKNQGQGIYTYPGKYATKDDAESVGKLRMQSEEILRTNLKGFSTSPYFTSGYNFTLTNHMREDANILFTLQKVVHFAKIYTSQQQVIYRNDFVAFDNKIPFRTPIRTRKPIIEGVQTAVVTGQAGEEIYTDDLRRVKVKFHWDQIGSADNTTCWIRVAQGWAGAGWGALFTPRVGHEVVVTFVNGDPDRPLVIGSVYNAENTPPYGGAEATKSTFKSSSSKGNAGFNEIRFEDKAAAEEIYVHAQKDLHETIKEDHEKTIESGDNTITLNEGDRKVTLKADADTIGRGQRGDDHLTLEKGSRFTTLNGAGPGKGSDNLKILKGDRVAEIVKGDDTETLVEGNQTTTLTKGDQETTLTLGNQKNTLVKGDQTETLTDGNQTISLVKGNQNLTLTEGNQTVTLAKGNQITTVTGARTTTVNDGDETHVNAKNFVHSVTENYTLKVEGSITIEATGAITIKSDADISMDCNNFNLKTKAATNITSTGAATIKSDATVTVNGASAITAETGGTATVKGASVVLG